MALERDPAGVRAADVDMGDRNPFGLDKSLCEFRIARPDRAQSRDHVGTAIEVSAHPTANRTKLHHLVDQQFHGMDAVAQQVTVLDPVVGNRFAEEIVIHSADLRHTVLQAHRNA